MLEIKGQRHPTRCARIVRAPACSRARAARSFPRMDAPSAMKKAEQLGSSNSFSAPAPAWPGDQWWQAYGDPQLSGLIDEALQGAPDLQLAQARLAAAAAVVRGAESTQIPQVTGSAAITGEKQSYNYLIPTQALPRGWNDYGAPGCLRHPRAALPNLQQGPSGRQARSEARSQPVDMRAT